MCSTIKCRLQCIQCDMSPPLSTIKHSSFSLADGSIIQAAAVQCTVYSIQCTIYTVQYNLYTVQCTLYTVQCASYQVQYSVHCLACSVRSTACSVKCTVYRHSLKCPLYSVGMLTVQCTVQHNIPLYASPPLYDLISPPVSTVQCSILCHSTIQYITVQYSTVQYLTVR